MSELPFEHLDSTPRSCPRMYAALLICAPHQRQASTSTRRKMARQSMACVTAAAVLRSPRTQGRQHTEAE
jgi:hypothetical protein